MGSSGFETVEAMTTDPFGNIWMAGTFEGTVDFDPDTGSTLITNTTGFSETFICSYDSMGGLRFVFPMPGLLAEDMETDSSGNLYLTGSHTGNVDADPGPGVDILPAFGGPDICILSYNPVGEYRWGVGLGSPALDEGRSISLDAQGNVMVAAHFFLTLGFEINGTPDSVSSAGGLDILVTKLDQNGNLKLLKSFGGPGMEELPVIGTTTDTAGGYWLSMGFQDSLTVNASTGPITLNSNGDSDLAIVRLDTSVQVTTAFSIGGTGRDLPANLAVDRNMNLYLTGTYRDSIDADPGPGTQMHVSQGEQDIIILACLDQGTYRWSTSTGGSFSENDPTVNYVNSSSGPILYHSASFQGSINIGAGSPSTISLSSNGFIDGYVAWFDAISGGVKGAKQFGGTEADVGFKIEPFPASFGPASLFDAEKLVFVTGHSSGALDVNPSPTAPCTTAMPLAAQPTGFFDIFVAKIILFSDSSTAISPHLNSLPVKLFPNPAKDVVSLILLENQIVSPYFHLSIHDVQGREMFSKLLWLREEEQISVKSLPGGLYFLNLIDDKGRIYSAKFVKI